MGITTVIGVTLTRRKPDYQEMDFKTYRNLKDSNGRPVDSVLRFHMEQGAEISDLISDYRPNDYENDNCGILIVYRSPALK